MRRTLLPLLLMTAAARAAAPLPSAADLQARFDAKDWPAVLQITGRLLTLQGPAAEGVDRVDAWLKKAEAQLQSSQFVPAAASFEKAAAEPKIDPDRADLALADALLARHSDRRGYHPAATKQVPQPTAYDILDLTKRPAALAALCDVQMNAATDRVEKLKAATDGGALGGLIKEVKALQPLDRVVHKSADLSNGLEKTIADHFVATTKAWADATTKTLTEMKAAADVPVETITRDAAGRERRTTRRTGTTSAQQGEVRKMIAEGERLASVYGATEKLLDAPAADALKPAQAPIQAAYDQARAMQNDAYKSRT